MKKPHLPYFAFMELGSTKYKHYDNNTVTYYGITILT